MTNLTNLEAALLEEIKGMYCEDDNQCFTRKVTAQEKGILSSLVKKGLIYNAFDDMESMGNGYENHNYFPAD